MISIRKDDMGVVFSSQRDKKEYYKQQADKLKRQADDVRLKTENYPEAKRLENLAEESDKMASSIEQQLKDAGK